MKEESAGTLMVTCLLVCSSTCLPQSKPIEPAARRQIDAGNQAWIDGMKHGNVVLITGTYTSDAVDCSPEGDCVRGRTAIEEHVKQEMARLGKAESASVTSSGSVKQGASFMNGGERRPVFQTERRWWINT
jgi:hypothetical protein